MIPCKMSTPWGRADLKILYSRGIFKVITPSHGGLVIAKGIARKLLSNEALRYAIESRDYYFFEEDCASSIPLVNSDFILKKIALSYGIPKLDLYNSALESVAQWYPDYLIA